MNKEPEHPEHHHHEHHHHEHHHHFKIKVNTHPHEWKEKRISYKEVVILAFGSYSDDPKVIYTVEYFHGPPENHEGHLTKGKSVEVKDGMKFNVTETDQS